MNRFVALSLAFALTPLVASAQICQDDLSQDRQPAFSDPDAGITSSLVALTPAGDLRLNTNLAPISAEQIVLPFDQPVSISFLSENANASQTLGWIYYDDLISRGYINTHGTVDSSDDTLMDSDNDGIPDLHEDIYNISATRPYVGGTRRCPTPTTFTHNATTYNMPELASQSCTGYFGSESLVGDLPPNTTAAGDVVGQLSPAGPYTASATEFSDNGLYPQVPNLLEPRHPLNLGQGIGHLVFLNVDDDTDTDSYGPGQHFTPAADVDTNAPDGIPDYNVTAYDATGVPLVSPPDSVIDAADRTVNLGMVQGHREVVFFILNYGDKVQNPTSPQPHVLPCLREAPLGTCALHLRTPVAVFFSKSALNMDMNPLPASPVAERSIGCALGSSCTATNGSTYTGWLDSPTLTLLDTTPYGSLTLPQEYVSVARPLNNRMPHVILGAPTTDPFRWVLGFEDTAGGGDRDFNDVSFLINKSNGGGVVSSTVSADIPATSAADYTITGIRFQRSDDLTDGLPGAPTWYEDPAHTGACSGTPSPSITYSVAVDCRICASGVCTPNATPTWFPVVFPASSPNVVVINPLDLGHSGSQLCWKADIVSPNQYCEPTIHNVDVGYQAEKSGEYSRASESPIANVVTFGSAETPGSTWNGSTEPAPSVRLYDGKQDLAQRGHLRLDSLYDPEAPGVDNVVTRWDAGALFAQSSFTPSSRATYTSNLLGLRASVVDPLVMPALFPLLTTCLPVSSLHDLNADGLCDLNDGLFLQQWLQGWENPSAGIKRAWPMGGLQFSTPSFVGPPTAPPWMTSSSEQAIFSSNFATPLVNREAQTYVGTLSGVIHAFDSGLLRVSDDPCTAAIEQRGYFELVPPVCGAGTTRNYGTGKETFAYFPRLLLDRYVNNYTGALPTLLGSDQLASADASPTVVDVDLGGLILGTAAWTPSQVPGLGAKTALVTATGKNSPVVVGLDVTNDPAASPGTYPIPMFEFDMGAFANSYNAPLSPGLTPPVPVDGKGSRHAPFVGRFDVMTGLGLTQKWLAVVPTDFIPTPLSAGTVYFIDLTTGQPLNLGTVGSPRPAVVPLEVDQGMGGEALAVDLDSNGSFDTVYVPSISGKVWRISLTQVNLGASMGQEILRCPVADAAQTLEASGPLEPPGTQHIYSNIAVTVQRPSSGVQVQIYFGTADSPDDPTDPMATHYYVVNSTDATPTQATCAPLPVAQYVALDPDQRVWGGVSLDQDSLFVATAVGSAADACNLDSTTSGNLYVLQQSNLNLIQTSSINGQATSTPVMYDNHLFVARMNGGPQVLGNSTHNNPIGGSTLPRSKVMMWDSAFNGKLPQ